MKRLPTLQNITNQRRTFNEIRNWHHEDARRLLDACQGRLRTRIGAVTHGHDERASLPRTLCGIRWIPNVIVPPTFRQGVPTEDAVDCMTCLVLAGRS